MINDLCVKCVTSQLECLDCGHELGSMNCYCALDTSVEELEVYCYGCDTSFEINREEHRERLGFDDNGDFSIDDWTEEEQEFMQELNLPDVPTKGWNEILNIPVPCRHNQDPVIFDSGVKVHASSSLTSYFEEAERSPDFALYLDNSWDSPGLAYILYWPDRELPPESLWGATVHAIVDTYKKAQAGLMVDVGCIGAHGRTGTVLACMAVLDGMNYLEAIEFVREAHCSKAIETDEQEWFVNYFQVVIKGGSTKIFPDEDFLFELSAWDWTKSNILDKSTYIPTE